MNHFKTAVLAAALCFAFSNARAEAAVDLGSVVAFVQKDHNGFWTEYCAGAFVETSADPNAPAYVVSNAHCFAFFMNPQNVKLYQKVDLTVFFSTKNLYVHVSELSFGSMRGTDFGIYKLDTTVGKLRAAGIAPITVASAPAELHERIMRAQTPTETYSCDVDGVGLHLKEERYEYLNSYRYFCYARHGSSGSPLISLERNALIGVHNTGRPVSGDCSNNNPCELDASGHPLPPNSSANYGQRADWIRGCFDGAGAFRHNLSSCRLP